VAIPADRNVVQKESEKKLKYNTRKTFDRFTTQDSYTWNITHNRESTAVGNLKYGQWGPPLVEEKYRGDTGM
jgi:hypothetical protein